MSILSRLHGPCKVYQIYPDGKCEHIATVPDVRSARNTILYEASRLRDIALTLSVKAAIVSEQWPLVYVRFTGCDGSQWQMVLRYTQGKDGAPC